MTRRAKSWAVTLGTLAVLPLVTALDGQAMGRHTAHGQALAVAVTLLWWSFCTCAATPRLRVVMVVGVFAATLGEAFFSLVLGMYTYRLESIPAYVPPGHTLLYAAVFLFVRRPVVHRHRRALTGLFLALGTAFSGYWLVTRGDRYGFACFLAFVAIVALARRARLFFSTMFLLVAYLEVLGTGFGAWGWPPLLLGRFEALPSANPPSGIAVFYSLFDVSCLLLYAFARFESFERWVSRRVSRQRGVSTLDAS